GTCQGCHMTLPPQVVSEVKQNDCIITCGECDRILYFQEE
ncbi:MAG: nucleic acid-binding protein, partial [Anaerolineae bacterium]|nr:nucleic acid-binding protein [Anaerolineae bacterium]NIN97361.1 nucleic acid-binding protein [Anaerolineae bacterium]NIQ80296.1 nucleic acid-binding protein [Anaerolineae bacterium]